VKDLCSPRSTSTRWKCASARFEACVESAYDRAELFTLVVGEGEGVDHFQDGGEGNMVGVCASIVEDAKEGANEVHELVLLTRGSRGQVKNRVNDEKGDARPRRFERFAGGVEVGISKEVQ
jgi:hypothetical protein